MIKNLKEKKTKIHKDAFVAESSDVIGDVEIGRGSSSWYGTVIRGDMSYVRIGEFTNIQDNATVHVDTDTPCIIGDYVTIGHNAIVHGCEIGDNTLIGMGSIILNNAKIGDNCIIGAGTLITEGTIIPDNSLVIGSPGKPRRNVTQEEIKIVRENAIRYEKLWKEEHVD